jgi:hypothetical protein
LQTQTNNGEPKALASEERAAIRIIEDNMNVDTSFSAIQYFSALLDALKSSTEVPLEYEPNSNEGIYFEMSFHDRQIRAILRRLRACKYSFYPPTHMEFTSSDLHDVHYQGYKHYLDKFEWSGI